MEREEVRRLLSPSRPAFCDYERVVLTFSARPDLELGETLKAALSDPAHAGDVLQVTVKSDGTWLQLHSISFGTEDLDAQEEIIFDDPTSRVDSPRETALRSELASLPQRKEALQKEMNEAAAALPTFSTNTRARNLAEKRLDKLQHALTELPKTLTTRQAQLQKALVDCKSAALMLSSDARVDVANVNDLIRAVLPRPVLVHGPDKLDEQIAELVARFKKYEAQRDSLDAGGPLMTLRARLKALLKMHVATEGHGNHYRLLVEGRPVAELSQGTYLSLAFAALCECHGENSLILWDEPENGVHTTRRNKMRSLMLSSPQQFMVATHQPEFVPIPEESARIYHILAQARPGGREPICSLKEVTKTLSSAFHITRSLGIEASRLLFTANVAIWVEGPSDAIYWHDWIQRAGNEDEFVRGFDYTFLFTGGANLANHTASSALDGLPDALVNLLTICANAVVIVDADIDIEATSKAIANDRNKYPEALRFKKSEDAPAIAKALAQKLEGATDLSAEPWQSLLKPRVQKMLAAIEAASASPGPEIRAIVTWGRETENYLPDATLRAGAMQFFSAEDESPEANVLNQLTLGRWNNFHVAIETAVSGSTKTELSSRGKEHAVKRYDELKRKIPFAYSCIAATPEKFQASQLRDKGRAVGQVVALIRSARGD